jgi:hypothetical protein
MDNVSEIASPNTGSFVDYSVIQTLAENDRIINKKITSVRMRDKTTGKNVVYNENDGIKVVSGRIENWAVSKNSKETKTVSISSSFIPPNVQLTVYGSTWVHATVSDVTKAGFTINAFNHYKERRTVTIAWIAITLVGTDNESRDISTIGSVSDGMFSDFNVLAKLSQNDRILNRKILQHSFHDYTGKVWRTAEGGDSMRFRCGWTKIENIAKSKTKAKAITFTDGLAPPSIHVTCNNVSIELSCTAVGLGGFTINAHNRGQKEKDVDIFWMALVVDKE